MCFDVFDWGGDEVYCVVGEDVCYVVVDGREGGLFDVENLFCYEVVIDGEGIYENGVYEYLVDEGWCCVFVEVVDVFVVDSLCDILERILKLRGVGSLQLDFNSVEGMVDCVQGFVSKLLMVSCWEFMFISQFCNIVEDVGYEVFVIMVECGKRFFVLRFGDFFQ